MKNLIKSFQSQVSSLKFQQGFTLVELIVVITILSILIGYVTINLTGARNSASIETTSISLLTDIKAQQIKAMTGETQGGTTNDSYGIHFELNRYILFQGDTYSSSDPTNIAIDLDAPLEFSSINLPSPNIVFSNISGEVLDHNSTQDTVILYNPNDNAQKNIEINKYGAITVN